MGVGSLAPRRRGLAISIPTNSQDELTLGAAKRSEVIVFTTQEPLNQFTESKGWCVGADTGVAAIHSGGGASYDTDTLKKPVVGFVFAEKGLIGDLSLDGSKIDRIDR
jgi:lipid-binding SYLF domain-containing protein